MTDAGPTDATPGDDPTATGDGAEEQQAVDRKLLEFLVCPVTKQPLRYDRAAQELISDAAGLAFPIREGIPIMLVDEAREIVRDEDQEPTL